MEQLYLLLFCFVPPGRAVARPQMTELLCALALLRRCGIILLTRVAAPDSHHGKNLQKFFVVTLFTKPVPQPCPGKIRHSDYCKMPVQFMVLSL